MGRIRVLPDQVANQIAAGEVVDRPASVVKELLENSLDAGATRIRVEVEAGGRKLIRIADDGCGMNRDDALLAFERHATSKLRTADDLLSIATLGFRGEALPSIASVARVTLETATGEESAGTRVEIAGGKILHVDDAALPRGTTLSVADLFFNTPARRKFLRAESTELAHVTALVTHYALAHPEKHFELVSATHTVLSAPPVARTAERIYQIFGKDTLAQLLPVAAETPLAHGGLPEPPPWKKDPDEPVRDPGSLRLTGFYSKPELQKLNRNSIYIFVNKRLIRDRLLMHAITEAYRNVIPPTSFPVVLLFLEMPPEEVDVNVHPAKTEVRFRQQSHDPRLCARQPAHGADPGAAGGGFSGRAGQRARRQPFADAPGRFAAAGFAGSCAGFRSRRHYAVAHGRRRELPAHAADCRRRFPVGCLLTPASMNRGGWMDQQAWGDAAAALFQPPAGAATEGCCAEPDGWRADSDENAARAAAQVEAEQAAANLNQLGSLHPLGQLRESFILATGDDGLWIIDQHVAHERILFEKILTRPPGGTSAAPEVTNAPAGGTKAIADGGLCAHRRGAGAQRIRGGTFWPTNTCGEGSAGGTGGSGAGADAGRGN